jgi:hypothetical protein
MMVAEEIMEVLKCQCTTEPIVVCSRKSYET